NPKSGAATVTGRLTALGQPRAGVRISLLARSDTGDDSSFGDVRTDANGSFSLYRFVKRTTRFVAQVQPESPACVGPSLPPAGCQSETTSPPDTVSARVRVPQPTDPKRAIRAGDQTEARRSNVLVSDLPDSWRAIDEPVASCADFAPNLADL